MSIRDAAAQPRNLGRVRLWAGGTVVCIGALADPRGPFPRLLGVSLAVAAKFEEYSDPVGRHPAIYSTT